MGEKAWYYIFHVCKHCSSYVSTEPRQYDPATESKANETKADKDCGCRIKKKK